jgi:hypothetical protein
MNRLLTSPGGTATHWSAQILNGLSVYETVISAWLKLATTKKIVPPYVRFSNRVSLSSSVFLSVCCHHRVGHASLRGRPCGVQGCHKHWLERAEEPRFCDAGRCPLWVKSGHSEGSCFMSALPLKADIQRAGTENQLVARTGSHDRRTG